MNSFEIHKYPRTPHIEGSRLQPGDEDLSQIPFSEIAGKHLVIEEKCDGANSAISFDENGEWMYAKHTAFYEALPHYFLEFDILDRETGNFLDTPSRHEMLRGLQVVSVPVLGTGRYQKKEDMLKLLGQSNYVTGVSANIYIRQQ